MFELFLICLTIVLSYKILVFFLSLALKRNDIADISWGISFIIVVITTLFLTKGPNYLLLVVSTLVGIWGLRLALRIALRNKGKKEDFRYKELREKSGKNFLIKAFFQIFILQGILAVVISTPTIVIGVNGVYQQLTNLVYLGVFVWLVGFFFEAVGDYQLDKFLGDKNNKGKIMKEGLWKYSRHPNYFGEITMWWGIFLIALAVPNGVYALIGPIAITYLITKVSGIPTLEKKYIGNKEFEKYKRETSVLIPMLPKN